MLSEGLRGSHREVNCEVSIPEEPGLTVTLLEANHCPGAALFLFKLKGEYQLHTGDMRYHPKMKLYPELQGIRVKTLYLDTTYCDDSYSFPPQDEAIESALEIMRRERKPKTLFVVGSYTIGKERVFLRAAEEFGTKVFCMPDKYEVLRHIDVNQELLTLHPDESFIHVVPMRMLGYKEITALSSRMAHRFDRIVGFKPTGWSQGKKEAANYGKNTVYSIPYSEHSSVNELREFVQWLQPEEILPTVNGSSPHKIKVGNVNEKFVG